MIMTGNPTCFAHSMASAAVGTRENGHAVLFHGGAGFLFFTHQPDDIGRGADELDVAALAHFGEVRVFRQQAISRMDRVHVGDFRSADDCGNIQVT